MAEFSLPFSPPQVVVSTAGAAAYHIYTVLLRAGFTVLTSTGDWTSSSGPGDSDGFVMESPSGAPHKWHVVVGVLAQANSIQQVTVTASPWVGVDGGWISNALVWPYVSKAFYVGSGTTLYIVANSKRMMLWGHSHPAAFTKSITVTASASASTFTGSGMNFHSTGVIPGMIVDVTGAANSGNNTGYELSNVLSSGNTLSTSGSAAVTEGPVSLTLTPRRCDQYFYVGDHVPWSSDDARPFVIARFVGKTAADAIVGTGAFSMHAGPLGTNIARVYSNVSSGYKYLTKGFVPALVLPSAIQTSWDAASVFGSLQQPSSADGDDLIMNMAVLFRETVSAVGYHENTGVFDGLILCPLSSAGLLGPNDEYAGRGGIGILWTGGVGVSPV